MSKDVRSHIATRLVIWDFDGTLAYREGGMWSAAIACVLNQAKLVDRIFASDDFSPFLNRGFPWHEPKKIHTHITNAEQWWRSISEVLSVAIRSGTGITDQHIASLLPEIRRTYLDVSHWRVFPDVVECLEDLSKEGWTHRILSNHVPELESLVDLLGLRRHFDAVLTSGVTGYEKPHPHSFALALGQSSADDAWMIGDSVEADIYGAAASNIRGVLVRKKNQNAVWAMEDLKALPDLIALHSS